MTTPPQVRIAHGMLEGAWRGGSAAFLGIPFAEPPWGERRFAAPVAAGGWPGIRPATRYGPTPQRRPFGPDTTIPEPSIPGADVLSVNVFTPAPGDEAARLPVFVWIHGGGFKAGSPASPWYDGRAFNRDGVVTVTLSYRLGFEGFGWLADAPLNRGLLDQILALEWVRDNIAAFGGDPGRVTIGGQSAGGGAVLALLVSPRAKGLFQGVIAASAAFRAQPRAQAEFLGRRLAALAGAEPTRTSLGRLDEERILDLQDELEATLNPPVRTPLDVERQLFDPGLLGIPFTPVADGDLLPAMLAEGIAANPAVPVLLGTTAHEFTAIGAGFAPALGGLAPLEFLRSTRLGAFSDTYARGHPELSPVDLIGQVLTDRVFRVPAVRTVRRRSDSPTWLYDFRLPGSSGLAIHCLDLPFAFDHLDAERVAAGVGDDPPQSLADDLHGAWVRFISAGEPGWPAAGPNLVTRTFDRVGGVGPGYAIEQELADVLGS